MHLHTVARYLFISGICLASYLAYLMFSFRGANLTSENISNELLISEAEIETLDKNNNTSKITADTLVQDDGIILAKNTKAEFQLANGKIFVYSDMVSGNSETCNFSKGVKIEFGKDRIVKSAQASMNIAAKKIHMVNSVNLESDSIKVSSNICDVDLINNDINFFGNVKVNDNGFSIACRNLNIRYDGILDKTFSNFKKDKLKVKKATFSKDIIANYGDYKLTTDDSLTYKDNLLKVVGNIKIIGTERNKNFDLQTTDVEAYLTADKKINKLFCKKYFIFKANGNTISGRDGVFVKNKVIINQNIRIISDSGELVGKSGIYDLNSGKASINSPSGVFFKSR